MLLYSGAGERVSGDGEMKAGLLSLDFINKKGVLLKCQRVRILLFQP